MKKTICTIFLLLTILTAKSQTIETSIVTDLNTQLQSNFNSNWISDLVEYRKSAGNPVYSVDALSDLARKNAYYFASVLEESSTSRNFGTSIKNIPTGGLAHKPLFGDPDQFKNTRGVEFPILPREARINYGIESTGEIMQELAYFKKNEEKLSDSELIDMMLSAFERKFGESHFIKRYLDSESHKLEIDDTQSHLFGSSIIFIIHKWYDAADAKWCHDVLLLNVTEFGLKKGKHIHAKKIPNGIF